MIFHTVIYCISIICSTFSFFKTEMSCAIMCNTCITCHIYHFDNKSQYVVLTFNAYSGNITYRYQYIFISNCHITSYVKVYHNIFSHPVKCHEPL